MTDIPRRIDRIQARIEAIGGPDADTSPELAWLASLTPEAYAAEQERRDLIMENLDSDELDKLLHAFTIHPSRRGAYALWPPPKS